MAEKCDPATGHDHPAACGPVPFFKVLGAPWLIVSPTRAARNMTGGSLAAFWVSFGLGIFLLALVVVGLNMWMETAANTSSRDEPSQERSLTEIWKDWHRRGLIGPAELMILAVFFCIPFITAITAWMYLPNVHHGGSVWRSCWKAYGAVASGVALLTVEVMLAGFSTVFVMTVEDRSSESYMVHLETVIIFYFVSACLLLYWLNRATRAVAGPVAVAELPLRCEGCGYDLTHRPAEDRCTECGAPIANSLTPDLRRLGCRWQMREDWLAWLSTSLALLISPTRFYGRLKLRRPGYESRRFAVWHYPVIGCAAAMWLFMTLVLMNDLEKSFFFLSITMGFVAVICGWCVHRLVGAVTFSWCVARCVLPDVSWAEKVMDYETAYMWALFFYNALLGVCFNLYGDWISDLGLRFAFGGRMSLPIQPVAILLGNAALIAAWMWRYVVAFRCVRWSNY